MSTTKIRLWFLRETPLARLYSKVPPERHPEASDQIWVPRSITEHTSKRGDEHTLTLPDWFAAQHDL